MSPYIFRFMLLFILLLTTTPADAGLWDSICFDFLHGDVKRFLNKGADVNFHYEEMDGLTPLMLSIVATEYGCARSSSRIMVTKLLLRRGADVNLQDNNGLTALHHAAVEGKTNTVKLLLRNGADVKVPDEAEIRRSMSRQSTATWP